MTDRDHGAGRAAHDVFGDAAHEQVLDAAVTMSVHRNEIHIVGLVVPVV